MPSHYAKKWFNFSKDNGLSSLSPLSLKIRTCYSDVENVIEKFSMISKLELNMDEITTVNLIMKRFKDGEDWKFKRFSCQRHEVFQISDRNM